MESYPSIFGIESPKIIDLESNTILLEHSIIINDIPSKDFIRHESIITRHREWIIKGVKRLFEINLLLYKYESGALTKYNTLKALENNYIAQLFRRKDGVQFKDAGNNNVRFYVLEISERWIDRYDYPDILNIKFISEKYIDITKSVVP